MQGKHLISLMRQTWQGFRLSKRVLLTSAGVSGCIILLRLLGWLEVWELAILDQSFRLRPLEPTDDRIVIVGIQESDLQQLRKFPIPDAVLAELLQKLKSYEPRAIGLDIYRNLPVKPGTNELFDIYRSTPNLIGIQQIQDQRSQGVPPPPILIDRNQVGFNNLVHDPDSKVRRGLLYWEIDGKNYEGFALKLALRYLAQEGITPQGTQDTPSQLRLGKAVFPLFGPNDGGYVRADDGGYQFLANLRGPVNRFRQVSLADVLANKVPADFFRDRIVLIGSTAESLKDYFLTSYSTSAPGSHELEPISGVELQANFLSQILSSALDDRAMIRVWQDPLEWIWIFGWSWLGAVIGWRLRAPVRTGAAILLAISSLGGVVFGAFLIGWWIPLMPAAIGVVTSAIVIISHIAFLEEELKRSKEFLNGVINTIPDPIYVKDQQHRWIVVNEAFCRFLGRSAKDLIEKLDYDTLPLEAGLVTREHDQLVFETSQESENEASFTVQAGITRQIATKRSLHKDAAGNIFLVGVMRDITERKQMEEELKRTAAELVRSNQQLQQSATQLQYQATHDSLTGLPNRQLFQERLAQALDWASQNEQLVALLFLDLDSFKLVNDTHGHDVGDLLLKAVAQRLTRCLRGSDTVSRLGGDEFTVILPAIPSMQDATRVADKILATLSQPFALQGQIIHATSSIGVTVYPEHGKDTESLLKASDAAMYQAKQLGKSMFFVYDPSIEIPTTGLSIYARDAS